VTTAAPQRELDRKRAEAWSAYAESLRDLEGRDYEDAEGASWERLQRALRRIERDQDAPPPGA
jgi:hypothetical protein